MTVHYGFPWLVFGLYDLTTRWCFYGFPGMFCFICTTTVSVCKSAPGKSFKATCQVSLRTQVQMETHRPHRSKPGGGVGLPQEHELLNLEFSPEQTSAIYSREWWVILPKCLQILVIGNTNWAFAAGLCVIPTGQEVRQTSRVSTAWPLWFGVLLTAFHSFPLVDDASFNGYPHTPLHFDGTKISLLCDRIQVFNQIWWEVVYFL